MPQKIIVGPNRSINVIDVGPVGPPGPEGKRGLPGVGGSDGTVQLSPYMPFLIVPDSWRGETITIKILASIGNAENQTGMKYIYQQIPNPDYDSEDPESPEFLYNYEEIVPWLPESRIQIAAYCVQASFDVPVPFMPSEEGGLPEEFVFRTIERDPNPMVAPMLTWLVFEPIPIESGTEVMAFLIGLYEDEYGVFTITNPPPPTYPESNPSAQPSITLISIIEASVI